MKRILRRITDEPALLVALILAALNVYTEVSAEQAATIATWVESIVAIVGGIIIRQSVSPVAKLKRKGMTG